MIRQLADWQGDTFPLKLNNNAVIIYLSESQYVSEMEALVFRHRNIYASVVERFQKLGLLTEGGESAVKLAVDLYVDNRTERTLPGIDLENFGVEARKAE